jgi:glycosyltransferase involved in cell wall biosynthesis
MKITVVSSTIFPSPPPGYSGLEAIAYHCANGLGARGHQVTLIAPDGSHCPNATVVQTGPPGQHGEEEAYGGGPEHRQKQGDKEVVVRRKLEPFWPLLKDAEVVIDHSWMKWAYQAKAEGVTKAPVLGVLHAPVKTMYGSWPPSFPGIGVVEKACAVCISEDQARQFREVHDPCDARVAYNGVDTDFYRPIEGVKRTNRFLFLARFSTIKGPLLAIEACRKAGMGLDLVGDTSITQEPDYFQKCKSLCDGGQIRMVGPASRGECVWWFSQAHALIHPNFPAPKLGHPGFREPFGLAPVEAMLCGCPVIAGDYGAMRETVKDSRGTAELGTGVLVNTFDELVDIVKTASDQQTMDYHRRHFRDWAMKFSLQAMTDRYEQLCQEAIETGGW